MGSSPRVWGQASSVNIFPFALGIIPTRMGTSFTKRSQNYHIEDHPHAYGDKKTAKASSCHEKGSSPRVWGQVCFVKILFRHSRIIPTRMGTRFFPGDLAVSREDHPHAYGDKKNKWKRYFLSIGSSPRVWGQVTYTDDCVKRLRIIPTRMGTSLYSCQ